MTAFTVHLMRHGAVEACGLLIGSTDMPSTAAGDAACIARSQSLCFTRVESSDLIRARRPAESVAALRGVPCTADPEWRELDFGAWDGHATADLTPADMARFWADPDGNPPPGGERWSGLVARAGAAFDRINDDTLVLTHAGTMRAVLGYACGFSSGQCWAFDLPYACVLTLKVWPGDMRSVQITGLLA